MFTQGTRVKVQDRQISGHCRTPQYLKGKIGEVIEDTGRWRNPELLAYHKPGLPMARLFRVRFRQIDIWGADYPNPIDTLDADLYEHWLEDAEHAVAEGA